MKYKVFNVHKDVEVCPYDDEKIKVQWDVMRGYVEDEEDTVVFGEDGDWCFTRDFFDMTLVQEFEVTK